LTLPAGSQGHGYVEGRNIVIKYDLPMVEHTAPTQPESSKSLAKWVLIIGAGTFATSLPQITDSPLDLSLKNVLTKELQLGLKDVTDFFFLATFPWYIKPIAGLLSDSIPLFGTDVIISS
jgi:BT1 family